MRPDPGHGRRDRHPRGAPLAPDALRHPVAEVDAVAQHWPRLADDQVHLVVPAAQPGVMPAASYLSERHEVIDYAPKECTIVKGKAGALFRLWRSDMGNVGKEGTDATLHVAGWVYE